MSNVSRRNAVSVQLLSTSLFSFIAVVIPPSSNKKETPPLFSIPPPPPDIEFSGASSDFDSSQPEESFSDLPLSDFNASHEHIKVDTDAKKLPDDNVNDQSNWSGSEDDTDDALEKHGSKLSVPKSQGIVANKNNKKVDKVGKQEKLKELSMAPKQEENDSDWDSESVVPSEPSEEILPANTPPQGSDFELSSTTADETESDFDLDEITKVRKVFVVIIEEHFPCYSS